MHVNTLIKGVEILNSRPGLPVTVWLQVKVRHRGLGLRPRLQACSVCDT